MKSLVAAFRRILGCSSPPQSKGRPRDAAYLRWLDKQIGNRDRGRTYSTREGRLV